MKKRAPRNRTLTLSEEETHYYSVRLERLTRKTEDWKDKIYYQELQTALPHLPTAFADLIFLDPPYNLSKNFGNNQFKETSYEGYVAYLESWLPGVLRCLKPDGSVYLCGDWHSTAAIQQVLANYLTIQNRISWEREKGRGAKRNWKNSSEDIWFATQGNYYFDVEAVKLKKQIIAPYKENGKPKDWAEEEEGKFRMTYPGNLWTDLTVPFWSMPENTDHPTQKPEKLLAKLLLASCPEGGVVFDPFLGSGTTAVVARKLNRHFVGIEANPEFCMWALKRLDSTDMTIQGYDGVFWERNTRRTKK